MIDRFAVTVETRAPGDATNAYLLGDDEQVLVDPGGQTPELDAAAADVAHVAVTHTHPDHVGAVRAYTAASTATVWAFGPSADRFEAATGVTPDRCFRAGDELGASGVTVMDTPGHAPDHVAFCVDDEAVTGDVVFADSSVFVGTPDGDMRAYFASLRRLIASDLDRLHPGHGAVVDSPRERLHDLYAHRRTREQRVLDAVRNGATTVAAIVDDAYSKDLTGLRDLATASVRAHLEKLAIEERIKWVDDRVTPA